MNMVWGRGEFKNLNSGSLWRLREGDEIENVFKDELNLMRIIKASREYFIRQQFINTVVWNDSHSDCAVSDYSERSSWQSRECQLTLNIIFSYMIYSNVNTFSLSCLKTYVPNILPGTLVKILKSTLISFILLVFCFC